MLEGLAVALKQENMDKWEMLDVSFFKEEQEEANLIFDILAFIHNEAIYPTSQVDKSLLLWMRTAVNTIVDMLNQHVDHPFVKDSHKACEDFLKQSFNLIKPANTRTLTNFVRIVIGFANNFSLGLILISLILEEVHRIGELLLQSFYNRTRPGLIYENFRIYIRLLLSILPGFGLTASSVIGVGNPGKDILVIPKVSLAEIRRFSQYLDNWATLVDPVLLGFSQVSKDASVDLRQVKKFISDIKQKIFMKKIR